MDPDKDFNLTVGLHIREIREALSMSRESAFVILREYVNAITASLENN